MAEDPGPGPPLTLGTAGHIDHGKTALIAALTGTDTDRLAEEKRRGITIELGFAELELGAGRRVSVVDVPGHERLVRTMVAGATGFDLFLLVVAADDGVMPQTREHLAVLGALGIEVGVVALTKADLVSGELRELAAAEARALVPGAELVAVSARTGEGLEPLRDALAGAVSGLRPRAERRSAWPGEPPVLHVDRAFTLRGVGTVVTGTLAAGEIRRGDRAVLLPGGGEARVRSLQVHGADRELAACGQRVAVALTGVSRDEVRRGDVLAGVPAPLCASYRLDVELDPEAARRVEGGRRLHVHHGTREAPARVVDLGDRLAQLRLEAPLIALPGDRAVIRAVSPPDTVGGARVIDPSPPRHGAGGRERVELIDRAEPERVLERALATSLPRGLPADPGKWRGLPLVGPALGRFSPERWERAIAARVRAGALAVRRGRILPAEAPDAGGGEEDDARLGPSEARLLALLIGDGPEPRSPAAAAERLRASAGEVRASLRRLAAAGRTVRLSEDVHYPAETLEAVRERALAALADGGEITLAELRDRLGTTRKYAQALLEHLDAEGVTVRHGDRHVLRRPDAVPR